MSIEIILLLHSDQLIQGMKLTQQRSSWQINK